ncbi:MAG: hypothetical protein COW54_08845 [Rhodobacteraceae bacterium CG17_big_fil_post_rev_8_21_14_2_50_63_15]|nr:MAG: hypothetical protein COW54_08845 [Rhodobacteraceae bacterium CG17_big_fil_post_rev_8_21_14_2_50_63_15]
MQSTMTLKRHAELVDRMASSLGVDLEQKIMEAQMQFAALGDMVLACTGCANPEVCEHWLAQHRSEAAETAPDYCRNADIFARLKAGKRV